MKKLDNKQISHFGFLLPCLIFLFLVACSHKPIQKDHSITIDSQYSIALDSSNRIHLNYAKWWHAFKDDQLNDLIEKALANNPNLNQIKKRYEQAALLANKSYAQLLPSFSVAGNIAQKKQNHNAAQKEFSLSALASYELDFWDKNEANLKVNQLAAKASYENTLLAANSLVASIVETYLKLKTIRQEQAIIEQQIKFNQSILDLVKKRYVNGASSALNVLQQKENLARIYASLPDIKANEKLLLNQIKVLVGQNPSDSLQIQGNELPDLLELPVMGLSSDLLESRLDIKAAWYQLQSSKWAVASAYANRLPSFNLSANYSSSSESISNLLTDWMVNLVAGLTLNVFDANNKKIEQIKQSAVEDEKFENYKQVVFNAIKEVEDALTRNYFQNEKIDALNIQSQLAKATLEQAQIAYISGASSYLNVLNSLINQQSLERNLLNAQRDLALNRIELYRATGYPNQTNPITIEKFKNEWN